MFFIFIYLQHYKDFYCINCSIIVCDICHLNDHKEHQIHALEDFSQKIKSDLSTIKNLLLYD